MMETVIFDHEQLKTMKFEHENNDFRKWKQLFSKTITVIFDNGSSDALERRVDEFRSTRGRSRLQKGVDTTLHVGNRKLQATATGW